MRDHTHLVRDLLERGLQVEGGGSRHLKVTDGEKTVVLAASPGRGRAHANALGQLRRAGMLDRPESGPSSPKRGKRPEAPTARYEGPQRPFGRAPRSEVFGG